MSNMGTDFYWFRHKLKEGDLPESGLHIGKLRYGWVFNFSAYRKKALISYYTWKELTKNGYIYNKFGTEFSYDEFWDIVDNTRVAFQGSSPLTLEDKETLLVNENSKEYMNNGFIFTED